MDDRGDHLTAKVQIIKEMIKMKSSIIQLRKELSELESDCFGWEIKYKGHNATVECVDAIDGNMTLYIEDMDESSWNENISIYEFLELIK
ncbi:hypothetical protein WKH57_01485 [Niallia taxi]|uniref:hypothetical protein n=1 Tax=Niallia taxi TaxID=2499688 RepID=UPI00316D0357